MRVEYLCVKPTVVLLNNNKTKETFFYSPNAQTCTTTSFTVHVQDPTESLHAYTITICIINCRS